MTTMGTKPDERAVFEWPSGTGAGDEALRKALAGNGVFRIRPEHFLHKARPAHVDVDAAGNHTVQARYVTWLLGRALDLDGVRLLQANWQLRPDFAAQVLMDLLVVGGLPTEQYETDGALAEAISAAVRITPTIGVSPADVVINTANPTGTWFDRTKTGKLVSADGTGRAYAQFQACLGGVFDAADVAAIKPVLKQVVYTFDKPHLAGDTQGLGAELQAPLIAAAWAASEVANQGRSRLALVACCPSPDRIYCSRGIRCTGKPRHQNAVTSPRFPFILL